MRPAPKTSSLENAQRVIMSAGVSGSAIKIWDRAGFRAWAMSSGPTGARAERYALALSLALLFDAPLSRPSML
jgi:hypothetical protein